MDIYCINNKFLIIENKLLYNNVPVALISTDTKKIRLVKDIDDKISAQLPFKCFLLFNGITDNYTKGIKKSASGWLFERVETL